MSIDDYILPKYLKPEHRSYLPPDELNIVFDRGNTHSLIWGTYVDHPNKVVTVFLDTPYPTQIYIPFSYFEPSGDGTTPDFNRVKPCDFGHTIQLGDYEASTEKILEDFPLDD